VAHATRLRHQLWLCLSKETLSTRRPGSPFPAATEIQCSCFHGNRSGEVSCVCVLLPWPLMAEAQGFF